ncbi:MAG TPA: [Fe-Fe] hydrogenase large subunit C-terminal domain-containing protein, partial [Coprothermobacter proteolyticus]|nr:[Fe-Fe] hydrogenase large subunit C-terminal domain-containing protein [Coprothermobacter proteolyticus]
MEETQRIEQFLREALVRERKHGYVIGVSGGLDSAVVLKLLVRAVGKENVLGLILPERDTEKKSTTLARSLLEQEKVPYKIISMTPLLRHLGVYKDMPLFLLPTRGLKESIVRRFYNDYTKIYPISGGLSSTLNYRKLLKKDEILVKEGINNLIPIFEQFKDGVYKKYKFLDILACEGGCINGPGMDINDDIATRKRKILKYRDYAERYEKDLGRTG